VQLARWKGAYVLAVTSGEKAAWVRSLGADEIMDDTTMRFAKVAHDVDVVLDTVGGQTQARSWTVLKAGGMFVSVVSPPTPPRGTAEAKCGTFCVVEPQQVQLIEIGRLIDARHMHPAVAAVYSLDQACAAGGHLRGKIVLCLVTRARR
jgi:NADPH:quinone reductase-like Zn-dependent oxidoreductase